SLKKRLLNLAKRGDFLSIGFAVWSIGASRSMGVFEYRLRSMEYRRFAQYEMLFEYRLRRIGCGCFTCDKSTEWYWDMKEAERGVY
ncbi:MAG: hypothetical protein K2K98_11545, partial [Muribaculaceae bacterium]|nr:hypothetical protein [Muribaculaceae bacterium]